MEAHSLSICAVIAVRNEFAYLKVLLPFLANQNIDVSIIDNGSTDDSPLLFEQYKDKPVIAVNKLDYRGTFSLSEQLTKKNEVYASLNHDWIIHHDADEIFEHYEPGLTLRDAIEEADAGGFNVLNFEEYTFIPEPRMDYTKKDYYRELLQYYFFERFRNNYNRAWKHHSGLSNDRKGGHIIYGDDIEVYPKNHKLRHYIALSEEHAQNKYAFRSFDQQEIDRGWHRDRFEIKRQALTLPHSSEFLFRLSRFDSGDFTRSKPAHEHYWHWNQ